MLIKNIIEEIKKLDPIEIVTRYSPTQEQLDDNRQQAKQRGIDTREAETKKIDDLNRLEGKEKLEEEQNNLFYVHFKVKSKMKTQPEFKELLQMHGNVLKLCQNQKILM